MKKNVEIIDNLLTNDEITYLFELTQNKSDWEYQTYYNEPRQYFDSIKLDTDKLKNYYNTITNGGDYSILETGLIVLKNDRQLHNSTHVDESDISYITYINDEYTGGEFEYFDELNNKNTIVPKKYMTILIPNKVKHRVCKVNSGFRFSIYSFLRLIPKNQKNEKSLL
jgi:predicted 2-oxoglutarate/Fe(II)-dependent dioxygenase YbiX